MKQREFVFFSMLRWLKIFLSSLTLISTNVRVHMLLTTEQTTGPKKNPKNPSLMSASNYNSHSASQQEAFNHRTLIPVLF